MKSASPFARLLCACAAACLAAACSDSSKPSTSPGDAPATQEATPPAPGDAPSSSPVIAGPPAPDAPQPAVDRGTEAGPTSNDPKDYPGLKIETLVAGDGEVVTPGKKVKVKYIGTLLNGREFDSSWKRGPDPIEFALDGVVPGFRVGLLQMKVGERRRLTIPGQYAYKEAGSPGAGIGPNETLIFDVELVDVVD
jgi:hypothetical protein